MALGISEKWRCDLYNMSNLVLGSPLGELWDDLSTISDVMHRLSIPYG